MNAELDRYLRHVFGDGRFYVSVCTNDFRRQRAKAFEEGPLLAYPAVLPTIIGRIERASRDGFDAYVCAHGLLDSKRGRRKPNAAPIGCLWADLDAAPIPTGDLAPTLIVETSPGRWQAYWRLSRRVDPEFGELLNRRLTEATGADSGGWARTKLLRPAGSVSYKREVPFTVRIVALDEDRTLDPDDLNRFLPPAPEPVITTLVMGDEGDEPPVRLPAPVLPLWRGERPVKKLDGSGEIDRSASLWAIARVLWKHNASKRTIVAALAERDAALGWDTYPDRPKEYVRIAGKIVQGGGREAAPRVTPAIRPLQLKVVRRGR
jgi:hypothetical protein